MTEWTPNVTPTTTYEQEAGMLPSGAGVDENILNLTTRAETAATNAETAETNAETAETNAETAQAAAESARDAAQTAQTNAETAETNAETAQTAAEAAQTAAEAAQTAAETAETNAETAESNAQTYAANALSSANASASSATDADTAKTAAESARDATLAAYDSFDDRYLGAKASDPATDNDGDALVGGSLYFNTTDGIMKLYDGSAWVAAYVSASGVLTVANNLSDLGDAATARTNLGLGTAATTAATDYATAAQGTLAASATQPGDNVSTLTNDAGYLTSYTETDPVYTASSWYTTTNNSGNWDTAYGWGDHSTAGYLTSFTETNDLSTAVTWANVPDANITQSSVTQHQAALSITESQISDFGTYATSAELTSATANSGNWDTAYSWGDHSVAGYGTTDEALALAIALG